MYRFPINIGQERGNVKRKFGIGVKKTFQVYYRHFYSQKVLKKR